MTETHVPELEGATVRYNGDTWEFTGKIDVRRNGEVIQAAVRKTDRVRASSGTLRFTLQDPSSSLNPGNLGAFDVELERGDDAQYLVVVRPNATGRYRLDSMNYS